MSITFVFVVAMLSTAAFDRAAIIIDRHVDVNATVLVNVSSMPDDVLAVGSPYKTCGIYPVALAKCGADYDIAITINSKHRPSVATIIHEVFHGLGFILGDSAYNRLNKNGYIGFVKTDGAHLANKNSIMNKYVNHGTVPDTEMLYVLERIGYSVTYSSAFIISINSMVPVLLYHLCTL